jgi:hypothetical protein
MLKTFTWNNQKALWKLKCRRFEKLEGAALTSLGCHNKMPCTGWLKEHKFYSQSLETGKSRTRCRLTLLFLACERSHAAVSTHFLSLVCALGERKISLLFLLIRMLILSIWLASCPYDLFNISYFCKGTLSIQVTLERASTFEFWRKYKYSVHNRS